MSIKHYPNDDGGAGESVELTEEETSRLKLLSSLRFDNTQAIDNVIKALEHLRQKMLFNKLDKLFK